MPFYEWVVRSVPQIPARHRLITVLAVHGGLAALTLFGSLLLRFDWDFSQIDYSRFAVLAPILAIFRVATLVYYRSHVGLWRYVSIPDLIAVSKATTLSTLMFVAVVWTAFGFQGVPRSVFVIEWGAFIFLAAGLRLSVRMWRERMRNGVTGSGAVRKALIVGAGDAGAAFCSQVKANPSFAVEPMGFVDDDPSKVGQTLIGVPVYGAIADIPDLVHRLDIEMLVIAVPSATPNQLRVIVEACRKAHVEFRILPGTDQLLQGNFAISKLRRVDIADLLGRPETELDYDAISDVISGKAVLITGAAGTIGSELARRVLPFHPAELMLVDRSENPLVLLEYELRSLIEEMGGNGTTVSTRIADVTDAHSIRAVANEFEFDVVLHAAAHKHVYPMELAPAEAVVNNVGGTLNVARAAIECKASVFVLVSTDKAVEPQSIMGATKRLAEMVAVEMAQSSATRFVTVRFGNVLGSNASVVPIFQSQIERGGPVTVTHPDVERFFMTAREAAGLILAAATVGKDSGIYMLDMGVPVKIDALARTMIELSGMIPGRDIEIRYTGLKRGEKFTESLSSENEILEPTEHEKVFRVTGSAGGSINLEKVEQFVAAVRQIERNEVGRQLKGFVPGYGASRPTLVGQAVAGAESIPGEEPQAVRGSQGRNIGKPRFLGR